MFALFMGLFRSRRFRAHQPTGRCMCLLAPPGSGTCFLPAYGRLLVLRRDGEVPEITFLIYEYIYICIYIYIDIDIIHMNIQQLCTYVEYVILYIYI